jgi:hypothetical protein
VDSTLPIYLIDKETEQVWWLMPAIAVLGRPRQADHKFMAKLGYIVSLRPSCLTKQNKKGKEPKGLPEVTH